MPAVNELAPIYADDQAGDEDLFIPAIRAKKDTRSKLMKSKERAAGLIVNACPFGCQDHELDEQQYCRHLIGFTDQNDKRIYYPIVWREMKDSRGRPIKRFRYVNGEDAQLVQPGDHCERITICYRVYRENPGEQATVGPLLGGTTASAATAIALGSARAAETVSADLAAEMRRVLAWAKVNGYDAQAQPILDIPATPDQEGDGDA